MAQEIRRVVIGDTSRFALDVRHFDDAPEEVRHLGWAGLYLWVDGRRIWSGERRNLEAVQWTWIDLVEWLARAWPYIQHEEMAPFGLVAAGPEELRTKKLLNGVTGCTATEVEDAVHAYQCRHDMAAGLNGISLDPVWLLPEGTEIRVRTQGNDFVLRREWLLEQLERFAQEILGLTHDDQTGRATRAAKLWAAREPSRSQVVALRSNVSLETLQRWVPEASVSELVGDRPELRETEFMAAARLSTPLGDEARAAIVRAVAQAPRVATPALDEISSQARQVLEALRAQKPYQQGYAIAAWLRNELGLEDERVDPEALLVQWNVGVHSLPPLPSQLDAVACWGELHGPAVLTNPDGLHTQHDHGRRSTLAHEIAHLLLDRGTALPAAEVFGGSTPLHLEQRARAFAAEFLLPRNVAGRHVAEGDDFGTTTTAMRDTYGVSFELLGWQIWSGPARALLNDQERTLVRKWCRVWQR